MNNIVKSVLDIEYKAQKITEEAINDKEQIPSIIANETENLRKQIRADIEEKLRDFKDRELSYAVRESERIKAEASKKADEMKSQFESHRDSWVQCIFESILGGDYK